MKSGRKPRQRIEEAATDEAARRDRVLKAADALGISHKQLAAAAGLDGGAGQVRFHRWTRDQAHLGEEQLAGMEALLEKPLAAAGDGDEITEVAIGDAVKRLAALAGVIPEDELAGDVMRFLARRHASAIFGQALRLMVGAESENVRADMVRFLKECGFGKAIQAFEDKTPKAPMEDEEFLDALRSMIESEKARRAGAGLPTPEVPGDSESAEAAADEGDAVH